MPYTWGQVGTVVVEGGQQGGLVGWWWLCARQMDA